jgi:hypothetical protein
VKGREKMKAKRDYEKIEILIKLSKKINNNTSGFELASSS